jgi:hypothetical protein
MSEGGEETCDEAETVEKRWATAHNVFWDKLEVVPHVEAIVGDVTRNIN